MWSLAAIEVSYLVDAHETNAGESAKARTAGRGGEQSTHVVDVFTADDMTQTLRLRLPK